MPNFSEIFAMFSSSKYTQNDSSISEFMIPLISKYIRKNPTYPDLYNNLGVQFLFSNMLIEAEDAFTKAVELNPDYVDARINLLKILHKNGKFEKAYEHGKVLIQKNLPYPDIYFSVAEILLSLNQFEDALRHANRVLQLRPEIKKVHLLLAQIYQKSGQGNLAKKEKEKYLAFHSRPNLASEAQKMLEKI